MNQRNLIIILIVVVIFFGVTQFFGRLPSANGELFSSQTSGFSEAKASEVVELKNGDMYDLTASIVKKQINGQEVKMLAYNGSIPGPLVKISQGAEITVNVTNNTDVETTLHSHGVRVENAYDGTPDTQQPIPIGGTFTYKLKFPDAGVFWYHPHIREDYAQESGLYGNFLVTPADSAYWSPVNREEMLVVDDVLLVNGALAPFSKSAPDHTLMGRFGNVMLVNGEAHYKFNAKQGEVIRLYVTNSANVRPFNLVIPGAKLKLVGGDNGKYEREQFVDSAILAPSERVIIEALFETSGTFTLQNKTPNRTYDLANIVVSSEKAAPSYAGQFNTLRINNDVIADIDQFRSVLHKQPDKSLTLTMGMSGMGNMNSGAHMMPDGTMMGGNGDGVEWEDTMGGMSGMKMAGWRIVDQSTNTSNMGIRWDFKVGDKVKVKIFNDPNSMHPMQHPIHFHGQRFLVASKNGVANDNLVWKDTVLVGSGETVELLIEMSSPGMWMAHCHIAEHLEDGMMFSFSVNP
ncbi:MAG TPA: multicopper oxidase family protein [Candidatus Andersenbacteria bacterium]|nr:multicopper oxidase family protein [Candidatus Andersenbacteria bacterium]